MQSSGSFCELHRHAWTVQCGAWGEIGGPDALIPMMIREGQKVQVVHAGVLIVSTSSLFPVGDGIEMEEARCWGSTL